MGSIDTVTLSNKETIAYRKRSGGERVLILVHGNYSSSVHMDLFMEYLPDDYTIYAPDLRGFGDSSYQKGIDSLHDFAGDLADFMDKTGIESADFIGWSLGGGVVLSLAARHPEKVGKSIIIGSVGINGYPLYQFDENGNMTNRRITTKGEIEQDPLIAKPALAIYESGNKEGIKQLFKNTIFTKTMPSDERFDKYATATLKQRNLIDADYALTTFNMGHDHNGATKGDGSIDNVKGPVLVIQGKEDQIVSNAQYESIKNGLKDRGIYKEFHDSGHAPMFDEPATFWSAVISVLTG